MKLSAKLRALAVHDPNYPRLLELTRMADEAAVLECQVVELQNAFHAEYLQDKGPGSIEGCGDSGCAIKPPKGMATNGGCRCGRGSFRSALQVARRQLAAVAAEGGET